MVRKFYNVYSTTSDCRLDKIVGEFTSLKQVKRAIATLPEWTVSHFDYSSPHLCRVIKSNTKKHPIENIDPELYPSWYQSQRLLHQLKKTGVK